MSKPRIYGTCDAGCLWETVHREEFLNSASIVKQYATDGVYALERGRTYRAKKKVDGATEWGFVLTIVYKYWATADSPPMEFEETVDVELPETTQFDDYAKIKICGWYRDKTHHLVYELDGVRNDIDLGYFAYLDEYGFTVSGIIQDSPAVYLYNEDAKITFPNKEEIVAEVLAALPVYNGEVTEV